MSLQKIDWKRPLEHVNKTIAPIVYLGEQTLRDGEEIKDDFKHLVLCGQDRRANYVNDYGQVPSAKKGGGQLTVRNVPLPEELRKKDASSALPPVDVTPLADAIEDLRQEIEDGHKRTQQFMARAVDTAVRAPESYRVELATRLNRIETVQADTLTRIDSVKDAVRQLLASHSAAVVKVVSDLEGRLAQALIEAHIQLTDDLKEALAAARAENRPPVPEAPAPSIPVTPTTEGARVIQMLESPATKQRKPETPPVDPKKIDPKTFELVESAELKITLSWLVSHPLVTKVLMPRENYERRPRNNPEGDIRFHSSRPFGLRAKAYDVDRIREVNVFLTQPAAYQEVADFMEKWTDRTAPTYARQRKG